jgi:hypothetical protein
MRTSVFCIVNFVLAGLFMLSAAGWSFIQKGCGYYRQREAISLFEIIEQGETRYRNVNNRYLPFTYQESAKALKELKVDPKEINYYDFSVESPDGQTLRISAHLKPDVLRKWYLNQPQSLYRLFYEKKEGQKGKLTS